MKKDKYTFRDCSAALMDDVFLLRKTFTSQVLDHWLQMTPPLSDEEKIVLRNFQDLLILNSDAWIEQELALNFIGPVFGLARFTEPYRFNFFAERHIGTTVPSVHGDVELGGEPNGIIATGYRTPQTPLFAFSEFKKSLESKGDPIGQTLAAMLVGQVLNQESIPVYGCYIVGHDWHFMVLEGKNYTISHDFSAVTNELFDIFRLLKALKLIIMKMTA
ncbi:MAG: hypothetical protein AAF639_34790 [Chloroflexota bacterium]